MSQTLGNENGDKSNKNENKIGTRLATQKSMVCRALFRRKIIKDSDLEVSNLARKLNLFDLLALGVGSTLGAGVYVLTGNVARTTAGPAVIFSFLIAAIASIFAGFCYAEFGARVPRAGSAYIYSYVTVGEFWAFIIGYSLILEYMIGSASIARAWSATVDLMVDKVVQKYLLQTVPINVPFLSKYPDLIALAVIIFVSIIIGMGVRDSARINNILASGNVLVIIFVIVVGMIRGNVNNWRIDPIKDLNATSLDTQEYGKGGFFPWGFSGVLAGASTCFFAFAGFDTIASTGEEVKDPQKMIPIGIIGSLLISFLAYIGVSMSLSALMPYYKLDLVAPIPLAFEYIGWYKLKYVVAVGSMCGLSASLMGCMFPHPRILYAMASDGLLFNFLSYVNPKTQTPIYATAFACILSGILATFFDIRELIDLMSMGTLLSYTLVAACVLILRYQPQQNHDIGRMSLDSSNNDIISTDKNTYPSKYLTLSWRLKRSFIPIFGKQRIATPRHAKIAFHATVVACLVLIIFCAIYVTKENQIHAKSPLPIFFLTLTGLIIIVCIYIVAIQPQDHIHLYFKVPLVPIIPFISIVINVFLMLKLSRITWIQYAVFMALGFLVYFGYGLIHSKQRTKYKSKDLIMDVKPDNRINDKSSIEELNTKTPPKHEKSKL